MAISSNLTARLVAAFAVLVFVIAAPVAAMEFPGGRRAALALTYDDGLSSQLDIALPQLDAAGLKATFFLSRVFDVGALSRWRAAAQVGHELGNHSAFHPCLGSTYAGSDHVRLENYAVSDMLDEIALMNAFLFAIDGRPRRSYAPPCGQRAAGGEDYIEPLRASGLVVASRGVAGRMGDPGSLDPFDAPAVMFAAEADTQAMTGYVRELIESGAVGAIVFHGVGGDYLAVDADAHADLLRYLVEREDEVWVAPFGEIMEYLEEAGR